MSQEFLNQLLRDENSVLIDEYSERCMICLEQYGSVNQSTGAVELEVRLPCLHTVGTICITTWLQDHNSCPLCRASFFPAQPRPYLEFGITNEETPATQDQIHRDVPPYPTEICEWLCERLDLNQTTSEIAHAIAFSLTRELGGHPLSPEVTIATSIYIASYLQGEGERGL